MTLAPARAQRLRAPLVLALAALLAFEAAGGLVIFFARLAFGSTPGVDLHVVFGVALTFVYAAYQWGHWNRVAPFRARLDHALGLVTAIVLVATQATGLWLGALWWRAATTPGATVEYPSLLVAAHNIGSMLTLAFASAHLGAVLQRDRPTSRRSHVRSLDSHR